jgi:small subunit ribosomal protein S8
MSLNDLMSDFVARVNNALMAGNTEVVVLKNNLVLSVCKKLVTLGFFASFEELEREIKVDLTSKRLNRLVRISKPGQRIYASSYKMPKVMGGKGFNILTTSSGILTHVESKNKKVGGELLFQIT